MLGRCCRHNCSAFVRFFCHPNSSCCYKRYCLYLFSSLVVVVVSVGVKAIGVSGLEESVEAYISTTSRLYFRPMEYRAKQQLIGNLLVILSQALWTAAGRIRNVKYCMLGASISETRITVEAVEAVDAASLRSNRDRTQMGSSQRLLASNDRRKCVCQRQRPQRRMQRWDHHG